MPESIDVVSIGLWFVGAAMAFLGVKVTIRPVTEHRAQVWHLAVFGILIVLGAALIVHQGKQTARARYEAARELADARQEVRDVQAELVHVKKSLVGLVVQSKDSVNENTNAVVGRLTGRLPPADRVLRVKPAIRFLSRTRVNFVLVALEGDDEAMRLSKSLFSALAKSGWESLTIGLSTASYSEPIEGIWIVPRGDENRNRAATENLVQALSLSSIQCRTAPMIQGVGPPVSDGLMIFVGRNTGKIRHKSVPSIRTFGASVNIPPPRTPERQDR